MNFNFLKHLNLQSLAQVVQRIPRPSTTKGWLKLAGFSALGIFVFIIVFYQSVRLGAFGAMPTKAALENINNRVASEVYSVDGELLGRYYIQNRTNINYDDVAIDMVEALIAVEDERFYKHNGVDGRSLGRVLFKSILLQNDNTGGGSTISQQLAKNLFPRKRWGIISMPVNKCREIIIAQRLERIYTKKEILTLYMNTVPFGEDVYGIDVAAQRFFNTSPSKLTLNQSAVLAGMLQAPSAYNPRIHKKRAIFRRNIVFKQMLKNKFITQEEYNELIEQPLELEYQYVSHSDGLAPYFRAHLGEEMKNFCSIFTKPDGTPYNLYTDGLKIHTTIHSKWQRYAEEAVREHMTTLQSQFAKHWKGRKLWEKSDKAIQSAKKQSDRYKKLKAQGKSEEEIDENFSKPVKMSIFTWDAQSEVLMSPYDSIIHYHSLLNVGFLATEPSTGAVRAWVGGINHRYLKYDHIKAKRQAGSVFKPILYSAALQSGYSPCNYFENKKVVFPDYDHWSPSNADGDYTGYYSLKGGLANSVNTVAAQLIQNLGTDRVLDLATKMGIKSKMTEGPAIALGATQVDLYELAEVYGVFANRGERVALNYIIKIEDAEGNILYDDSEDDRVRTTDIFEPDVADQMTLMLQGVVDTGTARRIRNRYGITAQIAGKTGTTQKHADGRFAGYTPKMVGVSWVGGMDNRVRFRSLALGAGGNTALPIWAKFYKKMQSDKSFGSWKYSTFPNIEGDYECPYFSLYESDMVQDEETPERETIFDKLFRQNKKDKTKEDQEEPKRERPNVLRKKKKKKKGRLKKWLEMQKEKWRN